MENEQELALPVNVCIDVETDYALNDLILLAATLRRDGSRSAVDTGLHASDGALAYVASAFEKHEVQRFLQLAGMCLDHLHHLWNEQ